MKRAKITKIGGKFRIDVTDSRGQRTRPSFSTKAEALAALAHFEANKESGKFVVTRKATFSQALALSNLRSLCATHDAQVKEGTNGVRFNDGKPYVKGADARGLPRDPSHWWNAKR